MSQPHMSQDQILDLGQQWAEAELRGDADMLESLLDADFVCVGPLGFVLDKQQYVAGRRSGDLKQQAFTWKDVRVRVFGDTAIAVGIQDQRTTFRGRDASGQFRGTQVFARKGDGWFMVSLHLSPMGEPPQWARPAR
jgi:ketosteroid isomerase-like protein